MFRISSQFGGVLGFGGARQVATVVKSALASALNCAPSYYNLICIAKDKPESSTCCIIEC